MAQEKITSRPPFKLLIAVTGLIKMPIGLMSGLAALLGYAAGAPLLSFRAFGAFLGVFFLSAAAASFNCWQDRDADARMERTRSRPLPSGTVTERQVLVLSTALFTAGMIVLYRSSASAYPLLAGLCAVILYNGIYTPLKKKTALAFFPGLACGMVSPLIGWFAAGGSLPSLKIVYIMLLYGIWQVPHTWLIILGHGEDYRRSGMPFVLMNLPEQKVKKFACVWALHFALLCLIGRFFLLFHSSVVTILVMINAAAVSVVFISVFFIRGKPVKYSHLFHCINSSILALSVCIIIDPFLFSFFSI